MPFWKPERKKKGGKVPSPLIPIGVSAWKEEGKGDSSGVPQKRRGERERVSSLLLNES